MTTSSPTRPVLDRQALARRFLDLNFEQRQKFLTLLKNKGIRFELLPIVAADPSQNADPVALAPSQKRLWNIYQLEPDNTAYHIVGALNLHGELDPNRLQQALLQVVEQQKLLSSRFIESDDQVWLQPGPADILMEYHQPLTQQQLSELSDEHAQRRFNLGQQGPLRVMLLRLPAQHSDQQHSQKISYRLQVVMHHIASDGWSMDLFLSDWVAAYLTPMAVSAPSIQYSDYARWQAAFLEAGERERQLQFWREQLGDAQGNVSQPVLLLPYDKSVSPTALRLAENFQWQLSKSQSEKLLKQAQALQCSSSSLVLAAWQWALAMSAQQSQIEGKSTVSVGLPMAGRYRSETDNLIGFFVNTLVIRTEVNSQQSLRGWLQGIHQRLLAAQDNQTLPFDQLVESVAPKRAIGETPLFQVLFNHQVRRQALQIGGQLQVEPVAQSVPHALFDVALDVLEHEQGINFTLTYAADRYQKARIERLQSAMQQALNHLLELSSDSEKPLGQFSLLNQQQQQNWQALSQQTLTDYQWDDSQLFTDLVRRQAIEQPNAIALVHGSDEGDYGNRKQLTYSELESRSNALANLIIRDFNPQTDDIIAVCCERGIDMMIGFIATLKAGAAFLPMDPDYPADRLAYMLSDSGATLILSQKKLIDESFLDTDLPQLALDSIDYSVLSDSGIDDSVPAITIQPQQLAYVIYTSGSTGQPKGVLIPHIGFSMHVQTIGQRYGMTRDDVELLFASISFDGCIERWSVPLAFGSRLIIRDQELWSAEKTCQVLADEGVTISCLPPSYASALLDWIEYCQSDANVSGKPLQLKVRSWTLGGEAFTRELYQRLQDVLKPQRLINGYGPTETVVTPTLWDAYNDTQIDSAYAPIGTAIGERRLYVLDNDLNPVPQGMSGELYIGEEVGLARGYHQRPDLTAERFLPDPFISTDSSDKNGARMYRTGDRVQWTELNDGRTVLDYLGRVDQQIKIRGFRVELGEIEAALHAQVEITDVAVAACLAPGSDNKKLVAYCTLTNSETLPNWAAISEILAKDLPDYMVPSHYQVLPQLPLNPAGKVDRNALPEPDWQAQESAEYQAPESEQEIILAKVWGELLLQQPSESANNNESQGISRTANFFALGGDSIIALQVISRLKQQGWSLNPKDIFEHPALNALAPQLKVNKGDIEAIAEIDYNNAFALFPIQSHFFSLQPANVDHFNQHVYLQLSQKLNIEAFARALTKMLQQHPALACRYQQTDGVWSQQFRQIDQPLSDQLISSHNVNSEAEAEALCQQAQLSLNIEQGQLVKVLALSIFDADTNTSEQRLLLVIHHLAVDAVSWRVLLQELWQAYLPISKSKSISQNNTTAELIPLMPSATTASSIAALIKWGDSSEVSKRSDFWQQQLLGEQQLLNEQQYAKEKSTTQALVELNQPLYQQDCETIELKFSTAETQSLLQGAGQLGNQGMMSLLLTALTGALTSLVKNVESPTQATIYKLPILVESHGRDNSAFAEQDLSRTIGWFTSLFPLALPVGQSSTLQNSVLQNLESVSETLQQANQDLGISYGVLRHLLKDPKLQGLEPQVTFNYLGQYQSELAQAWFTPIKGGGDANDKANPVTTALTINCQISDGCLAMSWQFASDYIDSSQISASQKVYQQALLQVLAELPNSQQQALPEWPQNPGVSAPTTGMMKLLNQPVMNQPPLFCIHPVTGRTTGYQALAQKLNGQRSLYAIESGSFISHNYFDTDLKAMAKDYLAMIRECQPTGPYYLLGWSLGGALSMDIAKELEQAGETIAFIGLIDTYVPGTEVAEDQWQSPSAQGRLRQHLQMLLPGIDDAELEIAMNQLRQHEPQHWPSGFDSWLNPLNLSQADKDNASQMLYAWAVEQNMRQICQGYQLPQLDTAVHCWWAAEANQRGLITRLQQFSKITHQLNAENADHLSVVRDEVTIRDIQTSLNKL